LDEATNGDRDLVRLLQQWCGYSLTGDTREQSLMFVHGPGGNGKSVFLNVQTGILQDYATTAAMDTLTASKFDKHTTDLAMLRGARLVTASETEESQKILGPWPSRVPLAHEKRRCRPQHRASSLTSRQR
jgi:putative DNA primase/helicase